VLSRIDQCLEAAASGPSFTAEAAKAVAAGRARLATRFDELATLEPDHAEAGAGRLTSLLVETVAGALLLEQSASDVRKGLVALRYARRHLLATDVWEDRIAAEAARELLAYEDVDEERAAKAAA
jgi:hypothetical protein